MTLPPVLWKNPRGNVVPVLVDYREFDGLVLPSGAVGSGWAADAFPLLPAGQRTWFGTSTSAGVATANGAVADTIGSGHLVQLGPATLAMRAAPQWLMSWWADYSLWPASYTRRVRVTFSAVVEMTAPTLAEKPQIGMTNLGGVIDAGGPGQSGIVLTFDNGGTNTWRVRSRLTPLGATVNGNSSGIGAGVRFEAAFRYTQGVTPTVDVIVNGAILQTFTGIAALPVPAVLPAFPAAGVSGGFQATFGIAAAAGGNATMTTRLARYLVEELTP